MSHNEKNTSNSEVFGELHGAV